MVNSEEFTVRLKKIIQHYQLSSASFADAIGVQRSSISHILSGRNKPSLDFVMKILKQFSDVDLYWLLNGDGSFPKTTVPPIQKTTPKEKETVPSLFEEVSKTEEKKTVFDKSSENFSNTRIIKTSSEVDKIVVFYKDGSFELFQN